MQGSPPKADCRRSRRMLETREGVANDRRTLLVVVSYTAQSWHSYIQHSAISCIATAGRCTQGSEGHDDLGFPRSTSTKVVPDWWVA